MNGNTSILRNNLGLCKALKFTLFRNFKCIAVDLIVQKYRFGKERYIKQFNGVQE